MAESFDYLSSTVPATGDQSWLHKASLEAQLAWDGVKGTGHAAKDAVVNHPWETLGKVAFSAAAGIGLSYLSRGTPVVSLAARALGIGTTFSFITSAIHHGEQAFWAMGDTWTKGRISANDKSIMQNDVGSFLFNTGLMSLGALGGAKLWQEHLIAADRAKVPPALFVQMNPNGITADYYNKFAASEMMAHIASKPGASARQLSMVEEHLKPALRNTKTYAEYWDNEIANHAASTGMQPDHAAIQRFFVTDTRGTKRLNQLALELRALGESDKPTSELIQPVLAKAQEARAIIYGKQP